MSIYTGVYKIQTNKQAKIENWKIITVFYCIHVLNSDGFV